MTNKKNTPAEKDSPKMTNFSLWISVANKDALMALAAQEERSANFVVNKLIEEKLMLAVSQMEEQQAA